MPSSVSDAAVGRWLDKGLGASADSTIFGATMYLDFLTTAPSDDNGTGAVSWGQGRTAVATVDGTNWPAAAARAKTGAPVELPVNGSGSPITVVAVAWYSASTVGTYLGGAPVPGGTMDVPAGDTPRLTPTLSSPSPS